MTALALRTHIPYSVWMAEPAEVLEVALDLTLEAVKKEEEEAARHGR